MRSPACLIVLLASCAGWAPRSTSDLVCSAGTKRSYSSDSDVSWGEVEITDGCERPDQTLHGWAIELVASAPLQSSTRLVGRYSNGRRVGVWRQYDAQTGVQLGTFSLDAQGSGVEVIHDQLGHSRSGRVVEGKREGEWRYLDRDGTVVATEQWSLGKLVRSSKQPPWDPPMPDDACKPEDAGRDGCPAK